MMCGGASKAQPATEEIQAVVEKVKDQVLAKSNKVASVYEAVSYSTQVVAGTNFFVKVKVGDGDYIHLRIFRPLPPNQDQLELHSMQENKSLEDVLEHF